MTSLSCEGGNMQFQSIQDNKVIGADMVMDHELKVQWPLLKNETLAIAPSVLNVSGEEHRKVGKLESKTPSEGTSETNQDTGIPEDKISQIKSPLLRTILHFANKHGNDEFKKEMSKFILNLNDTARDDDEMEEHKKVEKLESKTPSKGTSKSRLLMGILAFAKRYGNDELKKEMCQFIQNSKEDCEPELPVRFKTKHGHNDNWKLLRNAYLLVKGDKKIDNVSALWKKLIENDIFKQKTPMENTVLHVAAENGDEDFVEVIVGEAPDLLTAKSLNGDTALHVAAKAGHFSVVNKLIAAHIKISSENNINGGQEAALKKILEKNNEGNTFFHEAIINCHHAEVMNFLISHEGGNLKEVAKGTAWAVTGGDEKKSGVYLAIEAGYEDVVEQALTKGIPNEDQEYVPQGKSLLLAAIIKKNEGLLDTILKKKPNWIHLMDAEERIPLHYAASLGYLKGVQYLLHKCDSCVMERDIYGYLPIHLASYAGHVPIVQELLKSKYCPDLREIVLNDGRNILHLAAQSGKFCLVKYILQASDYGLQKMINEQDYNGNTPLHSATMCCHPKIVRALTWDKRVGLALVNRKGQTACEAFTINETPSLRQMLTWIALKSAGVQPVDELNPMDITVPPESTYEYMHPEDSGVEQIQDRVNTLLMVSTLIITAACAIGFTLPGGINGSGDPGPGMAVMLHHIWFKIFIFCITISMYGAISVTIILIWAKLGDIYLAVFALKLAKPFLGITLGTLSLAFLAGVHLVIRDLTWLDTSFLAMGLIFILVMFLLYAMLELPSSASNLVVRYMSYYPFLLLESLVDRN